MTTATKIMQFLRDTLPHGEYRVYDYYDVVISHQELAGIVLGELMSEGRVSITAHHEKGEYDIVCHPSDGMVLKVLKHTVALVDTEYGFGEYEYETIGQLDLDEEE